MAKLPSYRRILQQDYPQQYQDLIGQLAVTLNYGFDTLYQLLNGKLTFADNMDSTIKTVSLQVDSTGKPTTAVSIAKSSTNTITGLIVAKVVNTTNSTAFPTGGVFISYTETTSAITINNVTGLQPNNSYDITVVTIR